MKTRFVFIGLLALIAPILSAPAVDNSIPRTLQEKGRVNILVSFKNARVGAIRDQLGQVQSFPTRAARTTALYEALKQHADETQENVRQRLRTVVTAEMRVSQLWITNQLAIKGASAEVLEALGEFQEISKIEGEKYAKLNFPVGEEVNEGDAWGVQAIGAPQIWAGNTTGAGVVIATIDTGVLSTHEALRDNFRAGGNNWFDPIQGRQAAYDDHSHGTHVTGTIAGRVGAIGVAPGAEWIACKACDRDGECARIDLVLCGQWVVCPGDANGGNPRCDLAPRVVSNSWVEGAGEDWYDEVVRTWIFAGIAPVFGQGNDGPNCGTVRSPADSLLAIGVGAHNSSNNMAGFSSVGPTKSGETKPDIAAPGVQILSSTNGGTSAYASFSGTSMATPHVAGLTALLFSKAPELEPIQIKALLIAGAGPVQSTGRNCGGIDEAVYPNNHAGAGKINAVASFARLDEILKKL